MYLFSPDEGRVKLNMKEIKYRDATNTDLDDLVDLWWIMQESHDKYDPRFYKNIGQEECKKTSRLYFTELLKKESCMIHVASTSGTTVGMIVSHFQNRPPIYKMTQEIEIEATVVHPDYRNKGILRRLLKLVENKAELAGVDRVALTVDHENMAKFAYMATGFSIRQHKMIKWI